MVAWTYSQIGRRSLSSTIARLGGTQDPSRTHVLWTARCFSDVKDGSAEATQAKDTKEKQLDRSLFTKKVPVHMPEMGLCEGRILKWYKNEGDVVRTEDLLCDIETPQFTYGMETEDEDDAIMGEILIEAPSGVIKEKELICYLLHTESKKEKKTEEAKPE